MSWEADPTVRVLRQARSDETLDAELLLVRIGSFSGSAISLRDALSRIVGVVDFDLLPRLRGLKGAPTRVAALTERLRTWSWGPPMKTAAWSRAAQRVTMTSVLSEGTQAILFVQTIPAFALEPGIRYGVYTDRVAREGASVGGRYASRFTHDWLKREEGFLRGSHRVYVMGSRTRDWLADEYGLPPNQVKVVGAGPNAVPGPPVASQRCQRFLFVGTQWKLKGGPELLVAFRRLRRENPDLELVLVGSSPNGDLPPGVRAVGRVPVSRMADLYSEVDALVIPTHMEAFGIALVEALGRGIPCIATTVGNQPAIIGDAGICVAPGDVSALSVAMRQMARDFVSYRDAARRRGRELASQMSWDPIARLISEDLLPRPGATGKGYGAVRSDG